MQRRHRVHDGEGHVVARPRLRGARPQPRRRRRPRLRPGQPGRARAGRRGGSRSTGSTATSARRSAYTYTTSTVTLEQVVEEVEVAQRLGLPASFTNTTELPFEVKGAVRFGGRRSSIPAATASGWRPPIVAGGGRVFEGTRVVDVDEGDRCTVTTESGVVVRADHVVLATHLPILDRGGFFAKCHPSRSYAMAVRLADGARRCRAACTCRPTSRPAACGPPSATTRASSSAARATRSARTTTPAGATRCSRSGRARPSRSSRSSTGGRRRTTRRWTGSRSSAARCRSRRCWWRPASASGG